MRSWPRRALPTRAASPAARPVSSSPARAVGRPARGPSPACRLPCQRAEPHCSLIQFACGPETRRDPSTASPGRPVGMRRRGAVTFIFQTLGIITNEVEPPGYSGQNLPRVCGPRGGRGGCPASPTGSGFLLLCSLFLLAAVAPPGGPWLPPRDLECTSEQGWVKINRCTHAHTHAHTHVRPQHSTEHDAFVTSGSPLR